MFETIHKMTRDFFYCFDEKQLYCIRQAIYGYSDLITLLQSHLLSTFSMFRFPGGGLLRQLNRLSVFAVRLQAGRFTLRRLALAARAPPTAS
jgi:hypothetical protein